MAERHVLIAPDSFKGTFSAAQVAAAIGRGLERGGLVPPDLCPVADGGEGTMDVLLIALGGSTGAATVQDPLGRPITASYGLIEEGGTAIVEAAQASGLPRLKPSERDPEVASSYGTGELIMAAVAHGAEVVLVALGGTATMDGGRGALEAIEHAGGLQGARLVCLTDTRVVWERAPTVFGPQKGASQKAVERLTDTFAHAARAFPRDPTGVRGTGAAGGLAGALWAVHDAVIEPGAAFVLDQLDFDARMLSARAVILGEGRIDDQSLQGKIAGEIGTRARQRGVPAYAVVGQNGIDRFAARMIDLMEIAEATTLTELEEAGLRLAEGPLKPLRV